MTFAGFTMATSVGQTQVQRRESNALKVQQLELEAIGIEAIAMNPIPSLRRSAANVDVMQAAGGILVMTPAPGSARKMKARVEKMMDMTAVTVVISKRNAVRSRVGAQDGVIVATQAVCINAKLTRKLAIKMIGTTAAIGVMSKMNVVVRTAGTQDGVITMIQAELTSVPPLLERVAKTIGAIVVIDATKSVRAV